MRFVNFNYSQQNETVISASSSNPNYPVENIRHEFRNKVWRSNRNGYFLIDSSNNKINFKEAAMGSELTATIPNGNYTASTLAAEIKTQLEVSGADTYTVSYSQTTGLWTISSNGTHLSLLVNTGTNQANCLLKNSLGFSNTDKTGSLSYTGARISIHTQEHITFDLRTTEEINSLALFWPKEDGIKLSSTAEIRVQANATNTWTSPAIDEVVQIDNDYVVATHFFTNDVSYRYWRVVIKDPANANLFISLGVVVLGKALDIQDPAVGFEFQIADTSKVTENLFGNQYVDEYPTKSTLSIKYDLLDYEDARQLQLAYAANGNRKPVFATIDHTDSVFNKNHFLIYGKMINPNKVSQIRYKYFGSDLVIEEIS